NVGIGTTAPVGILDINASGNRFVVNSTNGNVGIGITAPGSKLTVNGSINFTTGSLIFPDGTTMTTAASGSASSSAGWTNTSTTTSTSLNVNIAGDVVVDLSD
ncbi:MAG: hypothetical protein Q8N88_03890, partial [Nanoarchaeota archaeon]|nr:hypothetical protein [Nanoarchaeota archaeon]